MNEEDKSKPSKYPVYLLDPSSDNGPPEPPRSQQEINALFQKILCNPSFEHIRSFVLPKTKQPDSKYHVLASPLITWTRAVQSDLDRITLVGDASSPICLEIEGFRGLGFDYISDRLTLIDGRTEIKDILPVNLACKAAVIAPVLFSTTLATLCNVLLSIYYENAARHPGKVVRLALSEVRTRDIVLYRFLKDALARVDMSSMKVRTDTVQRPGSKEAVNEPIFAFCANCLKVQLNHQRCSQCKVSVVSVCTKCPSMLIDISFPLGRLLLFR